MIVRIPYTLVKIMMYKPQSINNQIKKSHLHACSEEKEAAPSFFNGINKSH